MTYYPSLSDDCLDQANASVAGLDAKIMDLSKNWNPTGVYKGEVLIQMVQENFKAMTAAADAARSAPISAGDAQAAIAEAVGKIQASFADAARFVTTAQQGIASGALVSAPDFKQWVVNSMLAQSNALVTAADLTCNVPWFANALAAYMSVFTPVWDFITSVVGEIIDLAKKILKVPGQVAAAVDTLIKVATVAGVAWVAYELFYKKKPKTTSRTARR